MVPESTGQSRILRYCLAEAFLDFLLDKFERSATKIALRQLALPGGHKLVMRINSALVGSKSFADRLKEFPQSWQLLFDEGCHGFGLLHHCFVQGDHTFAAVGCLAG